jgi:hypothetical protein
LQLLSFPERIERLLEDAENRRRKKFDWKNMYKLRHNWSLGACTVRAIPVGEHGLQAPVLVRFHGGVIYTVDAASGLRAWSAEARSFENNDSLLAACPLQGRPTSLAADAASEDGESHTLVVGTQDGSFEMYSFSKDCRRFAVQYEHEGSPKSLLVALALHSSFLVTMTASHILSIYKLSRAEDGAMKPPRLVHSLRSQTGCPPVIVSVRQAAQTVIAAVAYPIPSLTAGPWSIGLQEIHLNSDGEVLDNRTAVSTYSPPTIGHQRISRRLAQATQPTSVSYAHPYLLLAHSDNTLTMFLVSSTADNLEIGRPNRLWGHTSSVSVAQVEGKGKAVSVSKSGDEVRIWELEGSVGRHRIFASVPIITAVDATRRDLQNPVAVRGAVGFDDENVVLLREKVLGPPELVVYDFK